MKLKLAVLDLELSSRQKRIIAGCIGAACLVSGGWAFAGASLHTWKSGELLTAADLNGNFANHDNRISTLEGAPKPPAVSEWQPYTPDVKTDIGDPIATTPVAQLPGWPAVTSTGQWRRVGDSVEVSIDTVFPSCSANRAIVWYLPPGLKPDAAKLSGYYVPIGTAITVNPSQNVVGAYEIVSMGLLDFVEIQPLTPGVTADCSLYGNGGEARLHFSLPIQGWTANN